MEVETNYTFPFLDVLITKGGSLSIGFYGKYIEESANTKFLGLQIDNHLNWKNHIDQMIPKLSRTCQTVI
jgi:hypothetical protein